MALKDTREGRSLLRLFADWDAGLARLRAAMAAEVPADPPESTCAVCCEHITLLGGSWTADDGTTCCHNTGIAPYVPHKPKEA